MNKQIKTPTPADLAEVLKTPLRLNAKPGDRILVITDTAIEEPVWRGLRDRALAEAEAVDTAVAAGRDPGPLAGVPYGVKDLFDVAGLPTPAGHRHRSPIPPATPLPLVSLLAPCTSATST